MGTESGMPVPVSRRRTAGGRATGPAWQAGPMPITAVAFDFGGPVLLTPFERVRWLEQHLGLAGGSLDWRGPWDPGEDPLWQRMQRGEITERDYWNRRAEEVSGEIGGRTPKELFTVLYSGSPDDWLRPEALDFQREAQESGLTVAVFTNDLRDFQGEEWAAGIPFIQRADVIVDGSVTGVLKPHPRSYELLVEALERDPGEILYIDDQPFNVEGGRDAGLVTVWLDVTDPVGSYERARALLAPR